MSRDYLRGFSGHVSPSALVGRDLVGSLFDHEPSGDAQQSPLVQEECTPCRNISFSSEETFFSRGSSPGFRDR